MAATVARLKELHKKVGDVGVDKLFRAAKKDGLAVTRDLVKDFLSTDAPSQVFKKLPESQGKTGAEAQGFRLQADLIDYSRRKATWEGVSYSYVLVIIDVASRRVWALPLRTKAPQHVAPVLYRMLRTIKNSPGIDDLGILTTDKDNAFTNQAANVLESQGVTHRTHDPKEDVNATSVLDRAIQTIKRRLAMSLAAKGRAAPWPSRVAEVVKQYNSTSHPALHGDEPEDFNKPGHAVKRFLTEQDNAKKLEHNQKLLEKRKSRLEAEGGYRVPVGGVSKFRRSFYQSYGDVKEPERIRGSVITDKDGDKTDIKRIQVVNVFSGKAQDGLRGRNPRVDKQKDTLLDMMSLLFAFLEPGERVSTSAAAEELKRQMGAAEYRETLRKAGFQQLARAAALFDDEFEVEEGGYYLRRVG